MFKRNFDNSSLTLMNVCTTDVFFSHDVKSTAVMQRQWCSFCGFGTSKGEPFVGWLAWFISYYYVDMSYTHIRVERQRERETWGQSCSLDLWSAASLFKALLYCIKPSDYGEAGRRIAKSRPLSYSAGILLMDGVCSAVFWMLQLGTLLLCHAFGVH